MQSKLKNMILAALFLALCMLLPYITGHLPQIAQMISPMHIPVFLCGFVCGWPWAPIVGFLAPIMRFVLVGFPELFPNGISMAFELATYGLVTAFLFRRLPDKPGYVYVTLIAAMLAGRVVWGAMRLFLAGVQGTSFTFAAFAAGAFTTAVPGIVCHILLIPVIIFALERAHLIKR